MGDFDFPHEHQSSLISGCFAHDPIAVITIRKKIFSSSSSVEPKRDLELCNQYFAISLLTFMGTRLSGSGLDAKVIDGGGDSAFDDV
jgi:hypothetical protein